MTHHRWTSRKFWTVNFWQAVATGCLLLDKVSGGEYALLTGGLIGLYAAGNFADKYIQTKAGKDAEQN
jgi:hypothetical protein